MTGGVPPIIRATGVSELLGDIVINCTGGTPTGSGSLIPQENFQVSINANMTNRTFPQFSGISDALLIIDDAFPANPVPTSATPAHGAPPQILCTAFGGNCREIGTGGIPSPYQTQPNVFVGAPAGVNAVEFLRIPIDAPGTTGARTIRITNLRANAFQLGVGSSLIPTEISALVSVNGSAVLNINDPFATVAIVQPDLLKTVNTVPQLLQCDPHNASLLGGSGTASFDFSVQVQEQFPSVFKFRNYGTIVYGNEFTQQLSEQNVPGFQYGTESGFYSPSLFNAVPTLGLADFGTRIRVGFQDVTAGTHLFVPVAIETKPVNCAPPANCSGGRLRLVKAGKSGDSAPGYEPVASTATIGKVKVAEVTYSGRMAYAIYEVTDSNPAVTETATIPVAVAFNSSTLPGVSVAMENASFGPISNSPIADPVAPLPRFGDSFPTVIAYTINSCSPAPMSGGISSKSGPLRARVWNIQVSSGSGFAFGASIHGFTLTQTAGATCSPVVTNPTSFPLGLGYIPSYSSTSAPITIDFTGCNNAQFTVQIPLSANGGSLTGTIVRENVYP